MQLTLDALWDDPLEADLRHTTFAVLDLETTGGAPDGGGITEVATVKVQGGEQLGTLATLINPEAPVPPFITVLTGITTAMVLPAPRIAQVLPSLLEFLRGTVLVAHNAPYDVGFLKAACAAHGYRWPRLPVLDTAALARRVLLREEVPNRKLGTLAAYFRAPHQPTHRALADVLATIDVLHALIGRLGSYGVHTLGEALQFQRPVAPVQRAKRHLAADLPRAPGVYLFRSADDRPLYVGTSRDIAARVRSYFSSSERRSRINEMLAAAVRVEAIPCAHTLEAQVRELRLIAAHAPPYNRRSKYPERVHWIVLTTKPYPRLRLVRKLGPDRSIHLGPFPGRQRAQAALDAICDALPLRIGYAAAGAEQVTERVVEQVRQAFHGDPEPVTRPALAKIRRLADAERYEDAAKRRDRLAAYLQAAIRMQRLSGLTRIAELVAARRCSAGGWELAIIRHGRLAAAATAPAGTHPRRTLDAIWPSAETVVCADADGGGPTPCASAEESERILDWLERPETRLVESSTGWVSPAWGAARLRYLLSQALSGRAR